MNQGRRPKPLVRAGIELLVIVMGVLIALARYLVRAVAGFRAANLLTALILSSTPAVHAQEPLIRPGWTDPVEPVQMADNLFYVGSAGLSSFLITSNQGHALIDVPLPRECPARTRQCEAAGVRSLGHQDPARKPGALRPCRRFRGDDGSDRGNARTQRASTAPWSPPGGRGDFFLGDGSPYPVAMATRTIRHLDKVILGEQTLTAHLTPGHTRGCTTWSGEFEVDGEPVTFVSICSLTALPGYRLAGEDPSYRGIAEDFCTSIAHLRTLEADIFASTHCDWFDLSGKSAALAAGEARAFVDASEYTAFLDASQEAIERTLADQGQEGGCEAVLGQDRRPWDRPGGNVGVWGRTLGQSTVKAVALLSRTSSHSASAITRSPLPWVD